MSGMLLLLASVGIAAMQALPFGGLRGEVRDAATGQTLEGAMVAVVGDLDRQVITDGSGRYFLQRVEPGLRRVRVTRLGHSTIEIEVRVPDEGVVSVDFLLQPEPVRLPVVTAEADAPAPPALNGEPVAETPGMATAMRALDQSVGLADLNMIGQAQALEGPTWAKPSAAVYVRAAGSNLSLVTIDGAPVFAPYNLGGILDPIMPPAIGSVASYHGGAPARVAGGLSEVVEMDSRRNGGRDLHARAFVDLIAAGGGLDAPLGDRGNFTFSGRLLHGGATSPVVGQALDQAYGDALASAWFQTGAHDTVSATLFWNNESVVLSPTEVAARQPGWGNIAGSARYSGSTPLGRTRFTAAHGEFRTHIPIRGGVRTADGLTQRTRLSLDFGRPVGTATVGYGAQYERYAVATRFGGFPFSVGSNLLEQGGNETLVAAYVDGAVPLRPGLALSAGLRGEAYGEGLQPTLSPRLAVWWAASDVLTINASGGRYNQLVAGPDSSRSIPLLANDGSTERIMAPSQFTVATATHVVLGFVWHKPGLPVVSATGYWKSADGVPEAIGRTLENAGVDIWVRQSGRVVSVWGAYSYDRAWPGVGGDPEVLAGRHFLRAGGTIFMVADQVRFDAAIAYGTGLEFSVIPGVPLGSAAGDAPLPGGGLPVPPPPSGPGRKSPAASIRRSVAPSNSSIDNSYLRLNLQATADIRTSFFGRQAMFRPYIRVINALDRSDALFYQLDPDSGLVPKAVGSVPMIPVLGIEWSM